MNERQSTDLAVIFDMDGVIVDSNPAHKKAIKQFLEQHGKSVSDEYLRNEVFGRTNREWLRRTFEEISEERIEQYIQEKEQIFRDMFAKTIKPLQGLRRFLNSLTGHQIPTAVATSAPKVNADWVLDKTGLADYFSVVLHEGDVTHGKPHPEMYLKAAGRLNIQPEHCVVFEDSLSGVEAAKSAGTIVFGVTTTHSRDELSRTDYVISDFTEIDYGLLVEIYKNAFNTSLLS